MQGEKIKGLTAEQVKKSAKEHGRNIITEEKPRTFWQTYWEKYDDPIIIVLLVALGLNIVFSFMGKVEVQECFGILLSVIISTFVSALSEHSNETTFRRIRDSASDTKVKVYRDGTLKEILSSQIVCGDIILLQAGDMIPADGHIVSGTVKTDQSSLNGESEEAEKRRVKEKESETNFNDFWNPNNVYKGTIVNSGEAIMEAISVGNDTVYGKLTKEAQDKNPDSPLSVKLYKLAKSISKFGCISAVLIVIISFLNNALFAQQFDPVMIAGYFSDPALVVSDFISSVIVGIIIIVVAVPDGLPLMIAIVCSLNMRKLLKANVLVRRLIGIETSGGINILFTDKTGTITKGKPEVAYITDGKGRRYKKFCDISFELSCWLGLSMGVNTSARFSDVNSTDTNIIGGNPAEKAMLNFLGKKGIKEYAGKYDAEVIKKYPFSSDKKFSAVVIRHQGEVKTLIKGAPELILSRCSGCLGDSDGKSNITKDMESILTKEAKAAMRLIAFSVYNGYWQGGELPKNMVLLGVASIRDDVRPEAKAVVSELKKAGIKLVMVTGDRTETAAAIAREAGITDDDSVVLTSKQLSEMTDKEVKQILPKLKIVSRAMPGDKSRLVRLARELNMVVGMTGDGVNDAPALKAADVGFAMGGGSEAAAAASDIVILDDNLKSVKNAVLYGRTIYNSIKKFIRFQLTINVAAVTVSMLGPMVGIEKPLDISQMIWTNLMIDSLAAIAFGGEPALNRYMNDKPRVRDEDIIDKKMWGAIIGNSLYICLLSLIFFISPAVKEVFRVGTDDIYFYTGYFNFFIFISVFNAFNARCEGLDLLENLSLNKQFLTVMTGIMFVQMLMTYFGGEILRTAGLNLKEWLVVLPMALTIIPAEFIRKIIVRNRG